jgi:hypothetical protein
MICDLTNNGAPAPMEYELMIPMIVAFRGSRQNDEHWKILAFKAHQWLYVHVMKIGQMRGWLVDDIYKGNKPVEMGAEHLGKGKMEFTLYLEKFQFSKIILTINEK